MDRVPRAPRFAIGVPMFWRRSGDATWSDAISLNVSRSGVLFRAGERPAVGTEVELIFGLSWDPDQLTEQADLICYGRIVRAEARTGEAGSLAATIESYSFIRER